MALIIQLTKVYTAENKKRKIAQKNTEFYELIDLP